MRRHAKASSAGSNTRQAKGLGRTFRGVFATRNTTLGAGGSGAPALARTHANPRVALGFAALLAMLACIAIAVASAPPALAVDTCPNAVFRTGPAAKLPECRAYELVTPVYTGGLPPSAGTFFNSWQQFGHETINATGDTLYFQTQGGALSGTPGGGLTGDRYRVHRTAQGWQTTFDGIPASKAKDAFWPGGTSPDLDYYAVRAYTFRDEGNSGVFIRTPQGFEHIAKGSLGDFSGVSPDGNEEVQARLITDGGQHVVFEAPFKLEPNAPAEGTGTVYDRSVGGVTHVVSLLPGNVTPTTNAWVKGLSRDGRDIVFKVSNDEGINAPFYVRHDTAVTYEVVRPDGAVVGKTLKCESGPQSATLTYQWLSDGAEISGATSSTYTTTVADAGKAVQCQVTASGADGTTVSISAARLVEPYAETNQPVPPNFQYFGHSTGASVDGTSGVGQLLTCNTAAQWKGSPTFSYQWLSDGAEISGATSSTYTPVAADKGTAIQCRVRGSNADGAASSVSFPRTINAQAPIASADPAISNLTDPGNAPEAGDELSCSDGTWSGSPTFTYQWLSDGGGISGATASTYTLQAADEGAIQCRVTASNSDGSTQAVSERDFFGAPVPSGTETHPFLETFGSAAQPSFASPRGIAIYQATGDVYVMDAGSPASIKRYNPDGTPDDFSALGTNVIDGKAGADATPGDEGLAFAGPSESQIAIDNSGGATDGNIYVTQSFPNVINVFSPAGAYLGRLSAAGATSFNEACGVAVDPSGAVYVGDYGSGIHKFAPAANPPVNADHTATFTSTSVPCTLAAGAGPTAGFLFPAAYNGSISKIDSSTGEAKYSFSSGVTTVSVDPASGHVYALKGSQLQEFDASGAGSASTVSSTPVSGMGVAIRGSNAHVFISKVGSANVSVYGPAEPGFVEPPEQLTPGGVFGSPQVGNSLFCEAGSWSGEPSFTYQWLRNGSVISSATESSYTLTAGDLEKVIQCRVTASNAAGSTVAIDASGSGARYVNPPEPPLASASLPGVPLLFAGAFGGHVFYTSAGFPSAAPSDLYSYDIATQTTTQITPNTDDAYFVHVSDDGSHVYFISKKEIGGEGTDGQPNLYLWLQSDHSTKLVSTLEDQDLNLAFGKRYLPSLVAWTAAVGPSHNIDTGAAESHTESSPDGSVLLFTSQSQLTSFDNTEATATDCQTPEKAGEPCLELYRYDSNSDELTCVSCPAGGGPAHGDAGMQEEFNFGFLAAVVDIHSTVRNLTADAKTVFFETRDSLLPSDVNGKNDVYRWNEDSGLALISTGQDSRPSFLYGVTPNGSDVVIATQQQLVPWDENGGTRRLYDARVNGGFPPPESTVTEPCAGDICQGAPAAAPPPPNTTSASLNGAGNVTQLRCRKGQRKVRRNGRELCKPRKHRNRHPRRAHDKRGAAR